MVEQSKDGDLVAWAVALEVAATPECLLEDPLDLVDFLLQLALAGLVEDSAAGLVGDVAAASEVVFAEVTEVVMAAQEVGSAIKVEEALVEEVGMVVHRIVLVMVLRPPPMLHPDQEVVVVVSAAGTVDHQ